RTNAQKSTGPRTEAGKARSARNALKHGLRAEKVALPNEDPEVYQAQFDDWVRHERAEDDPLKLALIDQAVRASWKLKRCTVRESAVLGKKLCHAIPDHDRKQRDRAEAIGRRLLFEPIGRTELPQIHDPVVRERVERKDRDDPATLRRELLSFAEGVDWLLERWAELADILEDEHYWHYPEKFKAIWLLGRRVEESLEDPEVGILMLACHVAHPSPWKLWDEFHQTRLATDGKPQYGRRVEGLKEVMPINAEDAQTMLWNALNAEVARLKALQPMLEAQAELDRQASIPEAMFDGSPEGVLFRRYETACEREFHRSVKELLRLRKDAPAPEPAYEPESQAAPNEANSAVEATPRKPSNRRNRPSRRPDLTLEPSDPGLIPVSITPPDPR